MSRFKLLVNAATGEWQLVPLTAEEIAQAEADAIESQRDAEREAARQAERDQLHQVYLALRDGTGTAAERLRRVETVVAWLMRREALDQT